MRMRLGAVLGLLAAAAAGMYGCGGQAADRPEVLVARATALLEGGEPQAAFDLYGRALEQAPDHPQALMGMSLAQFQLWLGMLDSGVGFLLDSGVVDGDVELPLGLRGLPPSGGWIGAMAADVLDRLAAQGDRQLARLERLQGVAEWEFRLARFPVRLQGRDLFVLGSEWDRADTFALAGFTRLLQTVVLLLGSQSLEGLDEDLLEGAGGSGTETDGLWQALESRPHLLTLRSEGGDERWLRAGEMLGRAATDLLEAARLAEAEADDQTDDVMVRNRSLRIGRVDHWGLHGTFAEGASEVRLLWVGEELSLRETLERLRDTMQAVPDRRLRFEEDVLVPLGVAADFVLKTVGLETLAGLLGLGDLGPEINDLLDQLTGDTGEDLPALLLSSLGLVNVPKYVAQFDPGTFFSRPHPLRGLLPNTGFDPATGRLVPLASDECVRLGFVTAPSGRAQVGLHDRGPDANRTPGPGNDTLTVELLSLEGSGSSAVVLDREPLRLSEDGTLEARFGGGLPAGDGDPVAGNGTLEQPAGSYLVLRYAPPDGLDGEPWSIERNGSSMFDPDEPCAAESARDYPHFGEPRFASACLASDPPEPVNCAGPYPGIARDGIAGSGDYLALKSGSFNGLLWLNMKNLAGRRYYEFGFPDGWAVADVRMANVYVQRWIGVIESLGETLGEGGFGP